ncbi:adenosylhomocysteinase [Candidatus Acetothermia bacterium]|jgi:adenosylhomocysteinase|nr:adenosylhomocysteinase [Candidatus Acetothermia bacterium]MCI2431493.1 adenosylhomocysteinase [Candidatus Acetothermia bacterium]MCI2436456.1 adenosylhomocysteinase [Candidatus Acetothermia bacterium]
MKSIIRNASLASAGQQKIEWVQRRMSLLNRIRTEFERDKPFRDLRLALSIHLEAKTAYLAQVLKAGGAEVAVTGCNPLSTQDDVAAALAAKGDIFVAAWRGATPEEYESHLKAVLQTKPHIILDDGGDLTKLLHGELSELAKDILGGTEETTTGVRRLKALAAQKKLRFPIFAVNDAQMKFLFDNRYGTGQSTWDGIMRTTNLSIAGKTVVVAGYGWCGRGIALRAKGLGANVIITEVNPVRAIEAVMDGFRVMELVEAAPLGEIFVTATGCKDIITEESLKIMKDGTILANSGHFDVEIRKPDLERLSVARRTIRFNVEEFEMKDGRRLYLLAEGRLVNLAAGDGHPVEIMDLSFALQALTLEYIAKHRSELQPNLYPVPPEIDHRVALLKLETLGITIDKLSPEQQAYLERAL